MATPSLRNLGIQSAVDQIKPNSTDWTIQMLWTCILGAWFPSMDGYRLSHSGPDPTNDSNSNTADAVVIQVNRLDTSQAQSLGRKFNECQIMHIKCKKPSDDTPLGWTDTRDAQLLNDLQATQNISHRLFGAVAIGTKVQFYQFDGQKASDQLVPLHEGTLDIDDPAHNPEIERILNHIKTHAWDWAS